MAVYEKRWYPGTDRRPDGWVTVRIEGGRETILDWYADPFSASQEEKRLNEREAARA